MSEPADPHASHDESPAASPDEGPAASPGHDLPVSHSEAPIVSRAAGDDGPTDRPGRPAAARGGAARTALKLLIGLLALAGAVLLIVWLPPSRAVKTAAEATVLGYELAREPAWPKGATLGVRLSPADEHMLAVTLRTRVARHAAGEALESFDAEAVAAAFADAAAGDLVHAVTKWKGEIVYFDFVRHALPNGVIVRAGVAKAQRVGRVDAVHQRVFAGRWVWEDDVVIYEYTLRQTEGVWKVVEVEPWGSADIDGTNVAEGERSD
ncbi:MAG: hypothetical protein V2J16_07520 [Thermoleophilia bacterium]|nr:hypothetical protein [Thermoleophilia bacterium]